MKNIFALWHKFSAWLTGNTLGYLDASGVFYRLEPKAQLQWLSTNLTIATTHAKLPPLVLVSRHWYSEQKKSYPVNNKADVIKIAKQEFGNSCQLYLGDYTDGKRDVLVIQFKPALLDFASQAKLIIPETLLINKHYPKLLVSAKMRDQAFAQITTPDGLWQSIKLSPLLPDTARAAIALGAPADAVLQNITEDALRLSLFKLFKGFSFAELQQLANIANSSEKQKPWAAFAGVLLFSGLVYLSSAELYLRSQISSYQAQLSSISLNIDDAVATRSQFEELTRKVNQFDAKRADHYNALAVWHILAELIAKEVGFTNTIYDGKVLTLFGQAPEAAAILEWLHAQPYISDADFTNPVRQIRAGESFSLKLTVEGQRYAQWLEQQATAATAAAEAAMLPPETQQKQNNTEQTAEVASEK
ncbi:hypothetical protein GCM10010919_17260 [Alishewanella longhuensis]|uniref:Type II secretion system protein L n=1 Tax=Alishewanella longhuensis TaxID=1091037 RepID=A0ABQ3L1Y8_9ALTE|nr:hypothetical protein [Alishewanella longhuensis]GHG68091.1 hypothetical protein GCM10010919_17260 [Alishewanella longhuensis]